MNPSLKRSIHSNRTVSHREVTYILIENTFNMSDTAIALVCTIQRYSFHLFRWIYEFLSGITCSFLRNIMFCTCVKNIHRIFWKGILTADRIFLKGISIAVWSLQKQGSRDTALANWIIQCFNEHFILNVKCRFCCIKLCVLATN